jgi:fumarylacetoacetate (FAA) hydrolase
LASTTISNKGADGGPGRPVAEGGAGYSCIAEQRTIETLLTASARTPFTKFGDRVRIEMLDADGHSVFGAIEQEVVRYTI